MNVALYGKRDFADVIKLRILMGRLSDGLHVISSVLRETLKCQNQSEVDVMTEAERQI